MYANGNNNNNNNNNKNSSSFSNCCGYRKSRRQTVCWLVAWSTGESAASGRDDYWAWHAVVHLVYEFCFDCKRSAGKCQAIPSRLRRLPFLSPCLSLCVAIRSDPSGPNNSLAHFSINFTHLNILFVLRITLWLFLLLLFLSTANAH